MPQIRVNGVSLHYDEVGSGAETVVFSHSYLVTAEHFDPQVAALKTRYRCVAYDHRGHGRSERTVAGYEMDNLYADAVALIEALDCGPCHWVGLSTGGFIGLRLGIRRPDLVKSLVLMDTSADAEPRSLIWQYATMTKTVRWFGWWPVIGLVLPKFFGRKFLKDPARRDHVAHWKRKFTSTDRKVVDKFAQGIFRRESVHAQLPEIRRPTLVMVGEHDQGTPLFRAQRIADGIPNARLVVIPDAGHLCTVEEPEAVNAALLEFLAAHG